MNGLIGRKLGMTRIFTEEGRQVPVTAIELGPCAVVRRKTVEKDGYDAVQLGFGEKRKSRASKSMLGQVKASGAGPFRVMHEVRLTGDEDLDVGATVTVEQVFEGVSYVDVIGTTKGRGFQGVVKRHGMSGGRASHGSGNHRGTGSIGQCVSPARVVKGKKLPGHMGNSRVTTQNLQVMQLRGGDNVLLVKGSVPGAVGGVVFVRKAIKKAAKTS